MSKWLLMAALLAAIPVAADDKPAPAAEMKASSTMREMLAQFTGKRVALRIDDGQELDGTVAMVGDQLVQMTNIAGRSFFDAYVRLDSIRAILVKTR